MRGELTCDSICAAENPSLMIPLTLFLMRSKGPRFFCVPSMSIALSFSIPNTPARSVITASGTTPAISCISTDVIGVGGFVEEESRDADWR
jgi:hypothetical protein